METKTGPTEQEVVNGFTRVEVVHRKSKNKEVVDVAILPVSKLQAYAKLEGDPSRCAELLCGKKPGWADGLENASVYKVAEEGVRVNSTGFFAHLEHLRKVGALLNEDRAANPSPASSPESAS